MLITVQNQSKVLTRLTELFVRPTESTMHKNAVKQLTEMNLAERKRHLKLGKGFQNFCTILT